jgi:hypothetical protein
VREQVLDGPCDCGGIKRIDYQSAADAPHDIPPLPVI